MSNNTKNQQKELHTTIDLKHSDMLTYFQNIETITIPSLLTQKTNLKSKIRTLREHQIDEYMDICDSIKIIHQKIRSLKREKNQYLLDNSKYIFHYFEQKQQISNSDNQEPKPSCNVINSFFKINYWVGISFNCDF